MTEPDMILKVFRKREIVVKYGLFRICSVHLIIIFIAIRLLRIRRRTDNLIDFDMKIQVEY